MLHTHILTRHEESTTFKDLVDQSGDLFIKYLGEIKECCCVGVKFIIASMGCEFFYHKLH
jgi:hypothetical protein